MNNLKLTLGQSIKYKGGINQWAWLLHRISGLGLVLFLPILAIIVLGVAALYFAPATYGVGFGRFFSSPLFGLSMIMLILCAVYHILNGTRIGTLDIWLGMAKQAESSARHRKIAIPLSRSEAWWWIYLRLSGVAMLILITISMFGIFATEGAIQERWASVGWRVYDLVVLAVVCTHGLRGLLQVWQDYVYSPTASKIASWAILIGGGLFLLICATVIGVLPWNL